MAGGTYSLEGFMVKWKKSPACGGNGTIHRGCIIGDAHDTIPPRRVRIHTTTLTYSHQIRHSTRIFAHEHPRAAQRHAPDALSGLSTARDDPRAGPDRPGAGPELPGAPDATAPTSIRLEVSFAHCSRPGRRRGEAAPQSGCNTSLWWFTFFRKSQDRRHNALPHAHVQTAALPDILVACGPSYPFFATAPR